MGKGIGVMMGKPEGKRPLGRPRHGWEDNGNFLTSYKPVSFSRRTVLHGVSK